VETTLLSGSMRLLIWCRLSFNTLSRSHTVNNKYPILSTRSHITATLYFTKNLLALKLDAEIPK